MKYKFRDSLIIYILALFLPSVMATILLAVLQACNAKEIYEYVSAFLTGLTFFLIVLIYSKIQKISIKNTTLFNKVGVKSIFVAIIVAFVCIFCFSPISNIVTGVLLKFGLNETVLNFENIYVFVFVYILAYGIIAPFCEEFIFRGAILNGLKERGYKFAIIISALLFTLVHLSVNQTVYQFLFGLVLAIFAYKLNSIIPCVIMHIINNVYVLITTYLLPNNVKYTYNVLNFDYIFFGIAMLILGIIIIYLLINTLKNSKTETFEKTENLANSHKDNWLLYFVLVVSVILWVANSIFMFI